MQETHRSSDIVGGRCNSEFIKEAEGVFREKLDNLLVEMDTFSILGVSFCVTQNAFNPIDL